RAYDADGGFDETWPSKLQLVSPEEAERGGQALRASAEKYLGTALSTDQARNQSLIQEAFARNGLRQQNIPIYGSRIRIQGRNLPEGQALKTHGAAHLLDLERKLVAEYLAPDGEHALDIELQGGAARLDGTPATTSHKSAAHHTLNVDVTGRYFFG